MSHSELSAVSSLRCRRMTPETHSKYIVRPQNAFALFVWARRFRSSVAQVGAQNQLGQPTKWMVSMEFFTVTEVEATRQRPVTFKVNRTVLIGQDSGEEMSRNSKDLR